MAQIEQWLHMNLNWWHHHSSEPVDWRHDVLASTDAAAGKHLSKAPADSHWHYSTWPHQPEPQESWQLEIYLLYYWTLWWIDSKLRLAAERLQAEALLSALQKHMRHPDASHRQWNQARVWLKIAHQQQQILQLLHSNGLGWAFWGTRGGVW